jgi:hypothetical protein
MQEEKDPLEDIGSIKPTLIAFGIVILVILFLFLVETYCADAAPPLPIEATTLDLIPDDTDYDTFTDWIPVELPKPIIDTQTFEQDAQGVWHTNKPTIMFTWTPATNATDGYEVMLFANNVSTHCGIALNNYAFVTMPWGTKQRVYVVPMYQGAAYSASASDKSSEYIWDTLDAWIVQDGGTLILRWDHTQHPATVQQSSDLISWTNIATVPGTECQYVIDMPMQAAKRFYRVRIEE